MWNERYMKAKNLPEPKEWSDLAKAVYYDHTAISAPSRSGTTHLTIETILQGEGWDKGWATTKAMAGNHQTVTDRSFGVPEGVNSGQFGIGIVIDFFAFSAQAAGFPVKFAYPSVTTIVPANVGIVANAPNAAGAKAFVEFLLSERGQTVLLEPTIRRLPVNPAIYAKAPAGYPNPFKDTSLGAKVKFDATVSEKRNAVVAALYDQLITFQLAALKKATKAIHDAEAALAKKDNPAGRKLIAEARAAIAAMPVTDEQAASPGARRRLHRRQAEGRAPGRGRGPVGGVRQGALRRGRRPRREEALKAGAISRRLASSLQRIASGRWVDGAHPVDDRPSRWPSRSSRTPRSARPRPASTRSAVAIALFLALALIVPVATVVVVAFQDKARRLHAGQLRRLLRQRAVPALVRRTRSGSPC